MQKLVPNVSKQEKKGFIPDLILDCGQSWSQGLSTVRGLSRGWVSNNNKSLSAGGQDNEI